MRIFTKGGAAEPGILGAITTDDLVHIAIVIGAAVLIILCTHLASRRLTKHWGGDGSQRRLQRAVTLGAVFRGLITGTVVVIATFAVLSTLGINVAALVAGASVAGVALGFGAQSLVKDFLAGSWMLIEDQFGVGDVIDTGFARGTVEGVSLRTVRVRDQEGTLWHVPNGSIERIGNFTQQFSKAVVDVAISPDADLDAALSTIQEAARAMHEDPAYADELLEPPEVLGVESLGMDRITIRIVLTAVPKQQWPLARVLRERVVRALQQNQIPLPRMGAAAYDTHTGKAPQ